MKKVLRTQHDLKSCNGKDIIALSCDVENAKNVVVRHWKNGDIFQIKRFKSHFRNFIDSICRVIRKNSREKTRSKICNAVTINQLFLEDANLQQLDFLVDVI